MFQLRENIIENFALLLNKIYLAIEVSNYKTPEDYREKLSVKFGLDKIYDHYVIESCQHLLEDTELAITNYERFGLDGPTKYDNTDEKYLRLYGLLNAVYLQMSVPKQLAEIFKLNIKKDLIIRLKSLKIFETRNKLAAHTIDYNKTAYYRVAQITVEGKGERILIVGKDSSEYISLPENIKEYRATFYNELSNIIEIIINKLFCKKSKKFLELIDCLEAIKHKMNGGMVIQSPNGSFRLINIEIV